jgi:hypothetical protein
MLPLAPTRKPVVVLLLEHSSRSSLSPDERTDFSGVLERLRKAGIDCMVFGANFEMEEWDASLVPNGLAARGGFDLPRSAMTCLLEFSKRHDPATSFPVLMISSAADPTVALDIGKPASDFLKEISPESQTPVTVASSADLEEQLANIPATCTSGPKIVRAGKNPAALSGNGGEFVGAFFPSPPSDDVHREAVNLQALNSEGVWNTLPTLHIENPEFLRAVEAWFWARERRLRPNGFAESFGEWVNKAKDLGVLVPGLAFIAAETHSQWETLKRIEARKKAGNQAFEIEEITNVVPESSTGALVMLALILFLLFRGKVRPRFPS